MPDCPNVEIRELLPERAGGALSAADIARVDVHIASCERCSAELLLIQVARRTLRVAPAIDVGRIASGVVTATVAPSRPQLVPSGTRTVIRRQPRLRWVGWKAAAAITIAAAGVGSFAVWHSTDDAGVVPNGRTVAVAQSSGASARATAPGAATPAAPVAIVAAASPSVAQPAELGVGGGLSELSPGDLQSLLGDLGSSGSVAADPSFEEPDVIVPEVGDVNGWESL